jgi:hypothetical protein
MCKQKQTAIAPTAQGGSTANQATALSQVASFEVLTPPLLANAQVAGVSLLLPDFACSSGRDILRALQILRL